MTSDIKNLISEVVLHLGKLKNNCLFNKICKHNQYLF